MAEQSETLLPTTAPADGAWRAPIEQAINGVLGPIRRAPKRSNGEALYSVPWFLFCGDRQADARRLLSGLAEAAPVAIQSDGDTVGGLWDWRFFGDSVGAALAHEIVENRHPAAGEAWSAMLDLLRRKRPLMPLNGVVLSVAAGTLSQPSRDLAMRLRALIDGAMQTLDVALPVYLVVTGLEEIPGFDRFVAALPMACQGQAMGHRFPPAARTGAEAVAAFADAFDGVEARTRALMLTLLRDTPPDAARGVFQFTHGFAQLKLGLRDLVSTLTADSALQRRPIWRGLYFTGTPDRPVFLSDLSSRFLPTDQPIARRP